METATTADLPLRSVAIHCGHFDRNACRSCTLLTQTYSEQLASKLAQCHALLDPLGDWHWLPSVRSPLRGFRNKAKMAVSGSSEAPILGIVDAAGNGTDLTDCALYPATMQACFAPLVQFIRSANIAPYNIATRQGELKHVLLSMANSGEWMLRFVLRSREALGRITKHLPCLLEALPQLLVVSVNLLPEHKAVLEGEQEILLSAASDLAMPLNDVPLYLRPRGFFQTNNVVAAALYTQVRDWCTAIGPASVLDLFCGVGGFALHCADGIREVTGIESSADAIACARRSARDMGLAHTTFYSMDAHAFTSEHKHQAELVIVNPPRRGLGASLCNDLQRSHARWLIYSSCNAQTLAHDLQRLTEFVACEVRMFDMFAHTHHFEVATLLKRRTCD